MEGTIATNMRPALIWGLAAFNAHALGVIVAMEFFAPQSMCVLRTHLRATPLLCVQPLAPVSIAVHVSRDIRVTDKYVVT